ncbi:hypothetical protein ABEB36_010551 [Hypothenemus hampei]|uniref:TBC1 domain family member 30 n=1 Tax=Hypothenemus hampei TaxID=57062 RepID=A0ABD1EK48_HYPHA
MSAFLNSFKKAGVDGEALLKRTGASETVNMRFTIEPNPGESGFEQWVVAMKMVAQLPGGIPLEFRRRLWVIMAERHLTSRGIKWSEVETSCFSEWSHPADSELGIQIVKDLHRTGCSLFCGEDGQENQALLKKVLLAYARWNKAVGYCQGFNMLAALILQVTDRCESDALKIMIYLIEGVLPDSYFAESLRGLSVDMAVFRELLRSKLPNLSKHLDVLQNAAKDGCRSYEPPLTNVFTMQWFLTLFCNCLPQPTVLRVWDLIFLEGNEILLRTALAIWQVLGQRIVAARTADEFYCVMGSLTSELLESNLIEANTLVKAIVAIGPLLELKNLRDHYLYNITPWGTPVSQPNKQITLHQTSHTTMPLDISALKKQYLKLKQRQRQAHVIFSMAISRQPSPATHPLAMNHLLVGKKALGPSKRLGTLKGTVPPLRPAAPKTLHWKDTEKAPSSSSSSDTELCDEDDVPSSSSESEDIIEKSPNSQFADNLNSGDNNLMNSDNSENDAPPTLLAPLKTGDSLRTSPVCLKITSDSEDESLEFESFLVDRVKCLDRSDGGFTSCTRRNSELALQIIQENSLILHRIMQCQSRLSPSPPLLLDANPNLIEQKDIDPETRMENVSSWIDSQNYPETNEMSETPFESRFHNILEKSRSLDERCNSLFKTIPESKSATPIIGHSSESDFVFIETSVSRTGSNDTLVQSISDDGSKESKSYQLIQENLDLLKVFASNKAKQEQQQRVNLSRKLMQENVELLESISGSEKRGIAICKPGLDSGIENEKFQKREQVILKENSPERPNFLINFDDHDSKVTNCHFHNCDKSSVTLSPTTESSNGNLKTSTPSKLLFFDDALKTQSETLSSRSKSPNQVFNPFPVPLNSRQNKEVPLKLGLYRK